MPSDEMTIGSEHVKGLFHLIQVNAIIMYDTYLTFETAVRNVTGSNNTDKSTFFVGPSEMYHIVNTIKYFEDLSYRIHL